MKEVASLVPDDLFRKWYMLGNGVIFVLAYCGLYWNPSIHAKDVHFKVFILLFLLNISR